MQKLKYHPSTVGRGKPEIHVEKKHPQQVLINRVQVNFGDVLDMYHEWDPPDVILSDGGYGILGFEGDVLSDSELVEWYRPHVEQWSKNVDCAATLWFWNTERGWASVHNMLEEFGWKYVSCNIWNKGKTHIAGNVNTKKIKHFPKVTEVCVQYTYQPKINGQSIQKWLYEEWKRTGLPLRTANTACGVADAAVRKYLDQGHVFYPPPSEKFIRLSKYANTYGEKKGGPYYSEDGLVPMSAERWERLLPYFDCPYQVTNVWDRLPLKGKERIRGIAGRAAHLNQKPENLIRLILSASMRGKNSVLWEPFGGLFTGCFVARNLNFKAFGAEIDEDFYQLGVERLHGIQQTELL